MKITEPKNFKSDKNWSTLNEKKKKQRRNARSRTATTWKPHWKIAFLFKNSVSVYFILFLFIYFFFFFARLTQDCDSNKNEDSQKKKKIIKNGLLILKWGIFYFYSAVVSAKSQKKHELLQTTGVCKMKRSSRMHIA
jgi:hypothetical protein